MVFDLLFFYIVAKLLSVLYLQCKMLECSVFFLHRKNSHEGVSRVFALKILAVT